MAPAIKPLRVFRDIDEFARRHKLGTEAEFEADQQRIDQLNKEEHKFQAWVISKTRQTSKRSEYLIVTRPGPNGENKTPQLGEPTKLRLVFADDSVTRFWEARRVENPLFLKDMVQFHDKLATFEVTVHIAEAHDGVRPLMGTSTALTTRDSKTADSDNKSTATHSDSGIGQSCLTDSTPPSNDAGDIVLSSENSVRVNYLLSASEATKNAELEALENLHGRHANATERQMKAFEYFVLLRNPEFFVDLHEEMPHLKGAMQQPSWPGSLLEKMFNRLNPQQQAAYFDGFKKLECGICILPGGPGAGKTHFNLMTIVMAQLERLPRPVMVKGRLEKHFAKVLFIVDMNSPVDDVANRMVRLYKELGMKKIIIRMKGWGAEVRTSDRLNAAEDAASGEAMQVDFSRQFLRAAAAAGTAGQDSRRSCLAPGLDEAAWERYDEFKTTKYAALAEYMESELWESSDIVPLQFRNMIYTLYRDTLASADFIATTPVAASNHFRGMFKPDLVYFDEAPHARELTNLVAIANFDPIAWIFCGDHRQTVPYVGSNTSDSNNVYREQMQVSMMERAEVANAIPYQLLMNHRAFGGLHQLASTMWYGGKMVSGNSDRTPESLSHIRQYLSKFTGGRACTVPRLLVHIKNCGPEIRDGTSASNPDHTTFVMNGVRELLNNPQFKHPERDEPGTILIVSPYKGAFHEFKRQIKALPPSARRRVEARTVDVVQGHEADFVFLDLVKNKSTKFLDDPNRLCVALTRARLGEIVLMHPDMMHSSTFQRHSRNLRRIYDHCRQAGQVVTVDPEAAFTTISNSGGPSSITDASSDTASTVSRPTTPLDPAHHGLDHTIKDAPFSEGFTAAASIVSSAPATKPAREVDVGNMDAFSMRIWGIKANVPLSTKTESSTTAGDLATFPKTEEDLATRPEQAKEKSVDGEPRDIEPPVLSTPVAPCALATKPARKEDFDNNDAFNMRVWGIRANVPLVPKVKSATTVGDSSTLPKQADEHLPTLPAQAEDLPTSDEQADEDLPTRPEQAEEDLPIFDEQAEEDLTAPSDQSLPDQALSGQTEEKSVGYEPYSHKVSTLASDVASAGGHCAAGTTPTRKVDVGNMDAFSMMVWGTKADVPLAAKTGSAMTVDSLSTLPEQADEAIKALPEKTEEDPRTLPNQAEENPVDYERRNPEPIDLASTIANLVASCAADTKPVQKIVDIDNKDGFNKQIWGIKANVPLDPKTESAANLPKQAEEDLPTIPEQAGEDSTLPDQAEEDSRLPSQVEEESVDCEPHGPEAPALDSHVASVTGPCAASTKPAQKVDAGNIDAFNKMVWGIKADIPLVSKTESATTDKDLSSLPEKVVKEIVEGDTRKAQTSIGAEPSLVVPCTTGMKIAEDQADVDNAEHAEDAKDTVDANNVDHIDNTNNADNVNNVDDANNTDTTNEVDEVNGTDMVDIGGMDILDREPKVAELSKESCTPEDSATPSFEETVISEPREATLDKSSATLAVNVAQMAAKCTAFEDENKILKAQVANLMARVEALEQAQSASKAAAKPDRTVACASTDRAKPAEDAGQICSRHPGAHEGRPDVAATDMLAKFEAPVWGAPTFFGAAKATVKQIEKKTMKAGCPRGGHPAGSALAILGEVVSGWS